MKKKFGILMLTFALLFGMSTTVLAADGFADEYYRVNDPAELLTDSEEDILNGIFDEVSIRQHMDVTAVLAQDLNGYDSVSGYAEALYELCDYGYGDNKDGVLLLISMEEHDWYIATHGYGITAFTDAGIAYLGEQLTPKLSDGDYAGALKLYAELCDDFITQARNGEPYDATSLPKEPLSLIWLPISLAVGIGLALLIVGSMKAKLKTVHAEQEAGSYLKAGSMKVTEQRDLFLYHTVTRTERPKEKKSSGSSTHKSDSGSTYGGGGGKF